MRNLLLIGGFVIFGIIMFSCSVYTVDETEQVIVTRFGEVQGMSRRSLAYTSKPLSTSTK